MGWYCPFDELIFFKMVITPPSKNSPSFPTQKPPRCPSEPPRFGKISPQRRKVRGGQQAAEWSFPHQDGGQVALSAARNDRNENGGLKGGGHPWKQIGDNNG